MIATRHALAPSRRRPWEPRSWAIRREHRLLQELKQRHGKRLMFIAGCARSGTSLLRKLMPCFADTAVAAREQRVAHFLSLAEAAESQLVVKRTDRCHRELSRLPACVELVYCVRHPYDCLTSAHPQTWQTRPFHVTRRRWMDEYASLLELLARQPTRSVTFVRYEDLVTDPDRVQASLADSLGLHVTHAFSANPAGIQVHSASVGKWRRNPALAHAVAAFDRGWHERIADFCHRFGYGPPELAPRRPPLTDGSMPGDSTRRPPAP